MSRTPGRVCLDDPGGELLTYREGTRHGAPIAERVTVARQRTAAEAAAALLRDLPMRVVSTSDVGLADALTSAGASLSRHFVLMQCALDRSRDAHTSPARFGGRLRPSALPTSADPDLWTAILPSWRAAFPVSHPDHFGGGDSDAIDFLMRLGDGTDMGPLHRSSTLLVDDSGEALAGIMVNVRADDPAWSGPWIADIWRDPSLRGTGVGALLIEHAKAALFEDGYRTLTLAVTAGNDARDGYERQGFRVARESWILTLPTNGDS